MSFKLLAIRPLHGTDPKLLKGLKPNCIYRFYNDYDYIFNTENKEKPNELLEKESFIKYQDKYFQNKENKKDDFLRLDFQDVIEIKQNNTLPKDFFRENINVSVVVGENGSGKSSLLELIYFSVFILSTTNNKQRMLLGEKKPLCIELYLEDEGVIRKIDFCEKIIEYDEKKETCYSRDYKRVDYVSTDNIKYKSNSSKSTENEIDFYSNIMNYSLYGLNSNVIPWIKHFFLKNDGYQTPIVINPFREEGIINVNNEYQLSQARMIIYNFVMKQSQLLDNVYLNEFNFILDFNKHQYVGNLFHKKLKTNNYYIGFCDYMSSDPDEIGSYRVIIELIFESIIDFKIDKKLLDDIYDYVLKYKSYEDQENIVNKIEYLEKTAIEQLSINSYLCFLYIFKKIAKISKQYEEYYRYSFLFDNIGDDVDIDVNKVVQKFSFNFKSENSKISLKDSKILGWGDISSPEKRNLLEEMFIDYVSYFDCNSTSKEYEHYIEYYKYNLLNFMENKRTSFYKIYNDWAIINLAEVISVSKPLDVKFLIDLFKDTVSVIVSNTSFRQYVFQSYLKELSDDNSHITFKLKQALKYFSNDIFSRIRVDKEVFNLENTSLNSVKFSIDAEYFSTIDEIKDAPIAFFDQDILIVKSTINDEVERNKLIENGVLKPFPYSSLSSGEQQSIKSILTIIYHINNLLSVEKKTNKVVYNKFNIVIDELELYYHPEFQRRYVNNLINVLDIFKLKEVQFNILMSTHSPFILSDIPSQNVLKLKEGMPISEGDGINSFGANIHDLLADEFFLKNGFMGEFAKEKINDLVNFLSKRKGCNLKYEWDQESSLSFINLIGEPLIKQTLRGLHFQKYSSKDSIANEIERLQKILEND